MDVAALSPAVLGLASFSRSSSLLAGGKGEERGRRSFLAVQSFVETVSVARCDEVIMERDFLTFL
jgi:hypothetical protein